MNLDWEWLRSQLTPPRWRSWQSLFWVSVVVWFFSGLLVLSEPSLTFGSSPLTELGGLLFVAAIVWWQTTDPWTLGKLSLGPGAIAALFATVVLRNDAGELARWVFVVYPLLAWAIAVAPLFVKRRSRLRIPTPHLPEGKYRPPILVKLSVALVCSCWIHFTFLLQDWVAAYPTLQAADLSDSSFVVRVGLPFNRRGYEMVRAIEAYLQRNFADRTWSETERLLMEINRDRQFRRQLAPTATRIFGADNFDLAFKIASPSENEYVLTIPIAWRHRWLDDVRRDFELTCRVVRVDPGVNGSVDLSAVTCETDTRSIFKPPDPETGRSPAL